MADDAAADAGGGPGALCGGGAARHLPVISQPAHDVENGYGLVCVFAEPREGEGGREVALSLVFHGEASYSRRDPLTVNRLGTFLYRSYNYYAYKRTADINTLVYRGVSDDGDGWASLWTDDHCGDGEQTWSQGSKRDLLWHYSLTRHHVRDVPRGSWAVHGRSARPVVFVNVMNHLFGETDLLPGVRRTVHARYPVYVGGRDAAERFARGCVPTKPNLFAPFRCHVADPVAALAGWSQHKLRVWDGSDPEPSSRGPEARV